MIWKKQLVYLERWWIKLRSLIKSRLKCLLLVCCFFIPLKNFPLVWRRHNCFELTYKYDIWILKPLTTIFKIVIIKKSLEVDQGQRVMIFCVKKWNLHYRQMTKHWYYKRMCHSQINLNHGRTHCPNQWLITLRSSLHHPWGIMLT